jgi:hypothetical protein
MPAGDAEGVWGDYFLNPFVLGILFCFGFSVVTLFRYLRGLRAQREALGLVGDNYGRVERDQEHDPEVVRNDLLAGVHAGSIAARRVEELHRISVGGGEFDQLALTEVLAARESSKVSVARYVASMLVLLGLCGAVWGLSRMVFKMGPALKQAQEQLQESEQSPRAEQSEPSAAGGRAAPLPIQKSFETLINIMSESLSNTRSAFYSSLTGILASIVLLFFNWHVSRRQIEFLTDLEDLTATRLIPAFRPPHEAAELARAVDSFKEGSNFLVRLSDDLDGKVSQVGTSLDNLFAIVRKFGEGAEALQAGQERVYQAQAQLIEVVEEFRDYMSRAEAQQSDSGGRLADVVSAVEVSNQNLGRALSEWQGRHEDVLQLIQANDEKSGREAASARDLALHGIGEVAGLIRSSLGEQVSSFREQALALLTKQQEGNQQHMDELLLRQSDFIAGLRRAVEESDGHRELIDGLSKAMESERAAFADRLQHVLSRSDDALREVLGEQRKILDVTGMRRVEERLESFVSASQSEFSSLLRKQESLDRQFAELGGLAGRVAALLRLLAGVAVVSIPVFAALAVMFILDLRPATLAAQAVTLAAVAGVIFFAAWFLRAKT